MATSQYTYHPYHTIGAATVLVWDPAAASGSGAWEPMGRVADAAVNVLTEQVGKDLVIKGLSQPIARRNRAKRYSLSFRMLENANPATLDLLFSEGAEQTRRPGGLKATSEVLRFYGEEYIELAHPYGIPESALDGVSNLQAAAAGGGGMIPPGTYYYWIAPALEDPGKPVLEGMTAIAGPVVVGTDEVVTITFTPPPGYVPDKYRVYYNTVNEVENAQLIGESATGSPITIPAHIEQGPYAGPAAPPVQLWNYGGLDAYTLDADYSLSSRLGMIQRKETGGIAEGIRTLAVYAYRQAPAIETNLGDSWEQERHRRIKLVQLGPHCTDPGNWAETGLEFELFKVSVSLNDTSFAFSEGDFGEGAPVTWDCLYDGTQGMVGTVRTAFGVLENY